MVEIFKEPELELLESPEIALQWETVCKELNMESQLSLSKNSPTSQPPPYMTIDARTSKIIRTLNPIRTELKSYSQSTIPLEVLTEIQKCITNKWYDKIYIFSDDKTPDPFVIGKRDESYNTHWDLIARWGAELIPFEFMEQKALARMKQKTLEALNDLKGKVEYATKNADMFISSLFDDREIPKLEVTIKDVSTY